jgi:hypothetical protein
MSVGIAAACRNGEFLVTATDGALTYGEESVDLALTKMVWFDDWQFIYAGEPSNADLVLENIRQQLLTDAKGLKAERIKNTLRQAYKKRFAQWTADYVLAPFGMEMDEFKRKGRKIFGDQVAADFSREMSDKAQLFREELMVCGWGGTPHAVTIYGMEQSGAWSGSLLGLGAIGAGRNVATSTLLLHSITRNSSLEDALYAVAAAKFSSERCDGVGRDTIIHVSRKRKDTDPRDKRVGDFLTDGELRELRTLWEERGRPKIPADEYPTMLRIAQRISGSVGVGPVVRHAQSVLRRSKLLAAQKSEPEQ